MNLMRFNRPELWPSPLDQLTNLRREIDRLFEAPLSDFSGDFEFFNAWSPALDLYEDRDNLIVRTELPGMKKEDIDVSIHEGTLTISGEHKSDKSSEEVETSRSERFFGRFQRSFMLPKPVEFSNAKATYQDGILTVTLPKTEESKPKQIEVKVN
ncbi:MAG: Hsp20/alpha crystallin family protein [Verrucomicrobia bacterium]|nr:Hsp20/alpha crystallin family protein [Verrucomicrobiota bacterium]